MQRQFKLLLMCGFLATIATPTSAANQLPFSKLFLFGSLGYAPGKGSSLVEEGVGIEFGGGIYINQGAGVFASYARSPGGIAYPFEAEAVDPVFDGTVPFTGTLETGSVTSVSLGMFIRREINEPFYMFSRIGIDFSQQDMKIYARSTDSGFRQEIASTDDLEVTGAIGSAGLGMEINDRFDLTFVYTTRGGSLENSGGTTTGTIPSEYQIGFLYKF